MKQITHEEAYKAHCNAIIGQTADEVDENNSIVKQYISQQEKKDKLLELKTERIKLIDKSPYLNRYNMSFDTELVGKLLHIDDKIKALEEELK